jgi:small neutral amino acid transporter SnatA (MarC family)
MLAVVFVSSGLMLVAGWMHEIIVTSTASVISAVMAIILALIATSRTLSGIKINSSFSV